MLPHYKGSYMRTPTLTPTYFTDEARAYKGMGRKHAAVKHSAGEYVKPTVIRHPRPSHLPSM